MATTPPTGVILIDKPVGISSFDVIRQLRKITGIRKFGHAGTLDPLASGLMVVGCQQGTKALHTLTKLDKTYEAEVLLGQTRSTGDMEGTVVAETEVTDPIPEQKLVATLLSMCGELELPVSAYSAIKRDGTPLYRLARDAAARGEEITDVPIRVMRVDSAECLDTNQIGFDGKQFQLLRVRFRVGSGTYIRSLAEELGKRLGYPATLYSLRRTRVGDFSVVDAYALEDVEGIRHELSHEI